MIEMVTLAEERLKRGRKAVFKAAPLPKAMAPLAEVAPILRGACSLADQRIEGAWRRLVLEFRGGDAVPQFRRRQAGDALRPGRRGDARPRHPHQALAADRAGAGGRQARRLQERGASRQSRRSPPTTRPTSSATSRVSGNRGSCSTRCRGSILVPGLGLFGLGRSKADARIAADIAEAAVAVITDAEATGEFQSIGEFDMFECEYWPPEQAKLARAKEPPLAGQIAADHRRRRRHRRGDGARVCGGRRRGGAARRRRGGGPGEGGSDRRIGAGGCLRRDGCRLGARRLRPGGGDLRRRRHRRVERRRGLAGPHRRGRRGGAAQRASS